MHWLVAGLARGWWAGYRSARAMMFVIVWAALFDFAPATRSALAESPYSIRSVMSVAACGVLAWFVAGLPMYLRATRFRASRRPADSAARRVRIGWLLGRRPETAPRALLRLSR